MFKAPKLTNGGKELYYANLGGEPIKFTTIQMGSGTLTGSIPNLKALVTPVVTIAAAVAIMGEYADVSGKFSNAPLQAGFYWREIGVFAANPKDPDNRAADILYCYQNAYDTADFIPVASEETVEKNITVPVIVGDTTTVSCTLSKSLILATLKDLENHDSDPEAHAGIMQEVAAAKSAADAAQKTADDALTAAQDAQDTADNAMAAANEAGYDAAAAQGTADAALLAANAAGDLAHTAKETADDALLTADNATAEAGVAKADAKKAQTAADAALEAVTKLAHTIDAVPSQNGSLTYTGAVLTPSWNSYNPETLTIGGTKNGTNAGTYTATFTPAEGYTWGDGTAATKSVTWSIGRATISTVPSQSGSLAYTGAALSPSWSNYDTAKLTIGGTSSATPAGTYTATFTPTGNYQWSDAAITARSANWTIGKAVISTVPSQSGSLAYSGSALSPAWLNYDAAKLTIGGTNSAADAGTYTATFTPTANYQWSDAAITAKSANWIIGKAAGSLTLNKTSLSVTNGALTGTITVTRAGDGAITATSSNTSIATVSVSGTTVTVTGKAYGTATITVNVAAGSNYNAPANKTCSVTVKLYSTTLNSNTWAMIREASDAGQGANIWSVGDTKTIAINGKAGQHTFTNLSIDVFIIGVNHNASREGGNRIHFQIGKIGGNNVALVDRMYNSNVGSTLFFSMNSTNSNAGGWSSCQMRTEVLGSNGTPTNPPANTMLGALPSDLRAVMKSCTKYSDNTGGGSNNAGYVTSTTDYLPLLSEFEYHGARSYANSAEQSYQAQYDYYKAGNSKIKYQHTATGSAASYWTRSVYAGNTYTFCLVYTDGSADYTYANYSYGVAPCFFV